VPDIKARNKNNRINKPPNTGGSVSGRADRSSKRLAISIAVFAQVPNFGGILSYRWQFFGDVLNS
jgi:hypothetical protein